MGIESRFYLYKDLDMTEVLEARLAEEGMDDGSISVLGALSDPRLLAEFVKENRRMFCKPIILIPFNIGIGHWVGILLEYDSAGIPKRAEYFNSMPLIGGKPSKELQQAIHAIDPRFNLHVGHASYQYDPFSCGAYAIENLLRAAKKSPLKYTSESIMAIREKHATCQKKGSEKKAATSAAITDQKPSPAIINSTLPTDATNLKVNHANTSGDETKPKTPRPPQ